MKSYAVLRSRMRLIEMFKTLDKIYRDNQSNDSDETNTMRFCSLMAWRMNKTMLVLYLLCGLAFISTPGILYLLTNEIEMVLPLYLMGIKVNSVTGFGINTLYHIFMVSVATVGFYYMDGLYANLVLNVLAMTGLIRNQFHEMNKMLLMSHEYPTSQIRMRFRNIILMHKEMLT